MTTSTLYDFITSDISRADLIALAALAVASLSAVYAGRQAEEARRTRLSAQKEARRPQRLEILQTMQDYCSYCGKYYTLYLGDETNGSTQLTARIEVFAQQMEAAAIYDMPGVAAESKLLQSMGWQLQRHLGRLGAQPTVIRRGTEAKGDERMVQELVEKFAARRQGLREVFAPYLHESHSGV